MQPFPIEYSEERALAALKQYRDDDTDENYIRVVSEIRPLIYSYCCRKGCRNLFEDIFQDVWNSFRSDFNNYDFKSCRFKTFIWGHLLRSNALRDSLRRNSGVRKVVSVANLNDSERLHYASQSINPEEEYMSKVLVDQIHECLGEGLGGIREGSNYFCTVKKMLRDGESWSNVQLYLNGIGRRNRIGHVEVYIRRVLSAFDGHADSWCSRYFVT